MATNKNQKHGQEFYEMFVDLLRDIYSAENQIVKALPGIIKAASNSDLKEGLSAHLDETKNQVTRLKKIFKALNENPTGVFCEGMEGLLKEGEEVVEKSLNAATKDAFLIVACQKVEHYEISSYGSARTLARHLVNSGINDRIDFDEIADLLQETLDEESDADEKLTQVAEGGFFKEGINAEAEKAGTATRKKK